MELIINNKVIDDNIENILYRIRAESQGKYLSIIGKENNDNIKITCPFHKQGKETHPSCFVYSNRLGSDVEYGYYKCFTCGEKGHLYDLVSFCLEVDKIKAKKWLVDNFSNTFIKRDLYLPEIQLKENKKEYLDESILNKYAFYHPYLEDRKISFDIAKKFNVGWNQENNSITFPVWDIHNNLVGITEREINTKRFYIPENMEKPIYLLNYIIKEHITSVCVCESQINALTCWSWGYPAIALFGTGSKKQYEILNKSGIRHYYLCFDGDVAGEKGASRFIENINKYTIITKINIPIGKDVNDLTKEEFEYLYLNS